MPFAKLTRRQILLAGAAGGAVTAGGGLWFGVWKAGQRRWAKSVSRQQAFSPNVYLAVGEDDTVTVWLTKAEMGQGVLTALPMLIAEELDADFSKLRVEQAVLGEQYDYGSLFTASSSSVISLWDELRKAGAAARELLVDEAAAQLGVNTDECLVENGVVSHPSSARSLTFGALAKGASRRRAPLLPTLKRPEQFKLIGTPARRLDLKDKTNGKAVFGLDVRLKGAVWVALRRCPVRGGTLKGVDVQAAQQLAGVDRVLPLSDAVLVSGSSTWAVLEGVRVLQPEWELPAEPSSAELEERLLLALQQEGVVVSDSKQENKAAPSAPSGQVLDATYLVPFLAHATMEPPNCSALIEQGQCTVWAPTQHPEGVREVAAQTAELPLSNVTVHRTLLGGGFGRRTQTDEAVEAVRAAKLLQKPVHLVWSREDDIGNDYYREAAAHLLRGEIVPAEQLWSLRLVHRVSTASGAAHEPSQVDHIAMMGAAEIPYTVSSLRVEWKGVGAPVRTGIWRSVGYSHNTFALESFIDELCTALNHDPLEGRLKLLAQQPRMYACLAALRELCGWQQPREPERALGLAICPCFGSFIALAVEVSRSARATPHVERVWCVADVGIVVNPDTVNAQIEGGVVFALSATLYGRITLKAGQVVESNFHNYPLLRQSEAPEVIVQLLKSGEPPGGVGELSVPPVAPALCNAWARLTGNRVRRLPFS